VGVWGQPTAVVQQALQEEILAQLSLGGCQPDAAQTDLVMRCMVPDLHFQAALRLSLLASPFEEPRGWCAVRQTLFEQPWQAASTPLQHDSGEQGA
jgi:hypothetical protein